MNEFIYSVILSEGLTKLILNTGTRLTLVTECYYTFNYRDHWDVTHYFIISSNCGTNYFIRSYTKSLVVKSINKNKKKIMPIV